MNRKLFNKGNVVMRAAFVIGLLSYGNSTYTMQQQNRQENDNYKKQQQEKLRTMDHQDAYRHSNNPFLQDYRALTPRNPYIYGALHKYGVNHIK